MRWEVINLTITVIVQTVASLEVRSLIGHTAQLASGQAELSPRRADARNTCVTTRLQNGVFIDDGITVIIKTITDLSFGPISVTEVSCAVIIPIELVGIREFWTIVTGIAQSI